MPSSGPKPCPKGQQSGGIMTTGAMGDDEGLLTEQDAAELLQVPLSTLRRWQREGAGPPCLKIGRQVRYRQLAVQRWLTGGLQAGSPDENR
jgi:excisionase family DNA binding protein